MGTPAIASRSLVPELLDGLPAGDPRAIGARRDLVWINALMFQAAIMRGLLVRHLHAPPRRILDIGAGDGRFMLSLARRLAPRWPGVDVLLLDRRSSASRQTLDALSGLGWRAEIVDGDVFEWTKAARSGQFDVVAANLFLHHFTDERLALLLSLIRPLAPLFVATEPLRASFPLLATRLLPVIGAGKVTLHDAAASVRAGFAGGELAALWPGRVLEERRAGLFTHAFAAIGDAG